ncbi:palmitoyltransferase ZDHHC4 [Engraulis encrasicolus]|uniref:palmitoyltransferase ZDHHC4 n=1 Tax=Engraulis encrasicolus TaxID=184585 RepID=UPI002FD6E815
MDFLTLFCIYTLTVLASIVLVCKYAGGQEQTALGRTYSRVINVLSPYVPVWLSRLSNRAVHKLFHERNNLFIYLHLLLEGAVYTEYSYEVFGYCREVGTTLTSLYVPYALLAVHLCLFYLCCSRDPGTVTNTKHASQVKVYPYDGELFNPGELCPTCNLVKPARSKHCRVCNRCVQRFDHHCVWVNNCVGAQNTRYFLLYLLSVCAMAGHIAVLTLDLLLNVVARTGLMYAHYVDSAGQQQPTGFSFVVQHLFLTFPRIVFMLGFLIFVFFLLAGYFLFHLLLAVGNHTSNEWYKARGRGCRHCHPHSGHHCGRPSSFNPLRGFYSRGIFKNLAEIFMPLKPQLRKKKHK